MFFTEEECEDEHLDVLHNGETHPKQAAQQLCLGSVRKLDEMNHLRKLETLQVTVWAVLK